MANQNEYNECSLRRELIRAAIERFQGGKYQNTALIAEPEVKSPKVKYEVEEMLNNAYMNRDEAALAMDIFKPVVAEDKELPVIVVIHGGGLVMGDRSGSRLYSKALASRGYLVFNIEYRLAPRANTCEQLDDVCAGMDLVGRRLVEFNVDFTRMFLTAESAGAYLAVYVAAMKQSKRLQEAIGYEPTNMTFKALGLHSGMFYTDREDPIGWLLADQFFGEKIADENFKQYLDPEHDEIVKNLPPVFLTTSRGDFLNRYTLMYHDALKAAGRTSHLVYYGDESLKHAFPSIEPNLATSIDAIDRMTDWFEEQAKEAKKAQRRLKAEQRKLEKINKRLESGAIIEQKSWKFIKELNSYSLERLESVAVSDCRRDYTYRQLFSMWDRYAEVFSALGITGKNKSRAGLNATASAEALSAFFGLNMTGTSVSMVSKFDSISIEGWRKVIEQEGITDLILSNAVMRPGLLKRIMEEKDAMGIRNVVVLQLPVEGEFISAQEAGRQRRNDKALRNIDGVLFMDDMLDKYEAHPIEFSDKDSEEAAIILHTSGTTSGICKPIPLADAAFNEALARLVRDERFADLKGRAVTCSSGEMSISYEMLDSICLPLAFGGKLLALPPQLFGPGMIRVIAKNKVNVLFTAGFVMNILARLPIRLDLSDLELAFLGGSYVSAEAKKRYDRLLKRSGSKSRMMIGYGLAEAGAACILSSPDREDDAIGYPLDGVKVRIFDEEENKFYDISDGPRTGVLYIHTKSLSSGRIDDRVIFELEEIDGEKYLNTFDLVSVGEDGALHYEGRMNKFFVNNEGIRFDAGLVETAVAAEPGIELCGLAPEYSKLLHDTVPVLYVKTTDRGRPPRAVIREALKKVFITDGKIKDSNLPSQLVISDEIPVNASGKVDVMRIIKEKPSGRRFAVIPVRIDGELEDVRIERMSEAEVGTAAGGIPEELEGGPMVNMPWERMSRDDGPECAPDSMIGMALRMIDALFEI